MYGAGQAAPPPLSVQPTPPPIPPPMPPPPTFSTTFVGPVESYMTQAILVTLFCCLPLGIAAIFQARAVDKAVALGDMRKAQSASNNAKNMVIAGFVGGLLVIVVSVIGNMSSSRL